MRLSMLIGFLLIVPQASAYEILVWLSEQESKAIPEDSEKRRFGENGVFPHPCGFVRTIDVDFLPPPDSEEFIEGTEKVVEFSREGEILNQWAMPVDSYVMGIQGDSIIVRYQRDQALRINTRGSLRTVKQPNLERELLQCPDSISKLFGDSDFDRCYKYKDQTTEEYRYIAFESVCT